MVGKLLGNNLEPSVGVRVMLDFQRTAVTGRDGAVTFEDVASGLRAVVVGDRALICRVESGRTAEVTLTEGLPEVAVVLGTTQFAGTSGVLVGLDLPAYVYEGRVDADTLRLSNVVRGSYYLALRGGSQTRVLIDGPTATASLGSESLVVPGEDGKRGCIVSVGSAEHVAEVVRATATFQIAPSGKYVVVPLHAGTYEVTVGDEQRTVEVGASEPH